MMAKHAGINYWQGKHWLNAKYAQKSEKLHIGFIISVGGYLLSNTGYWNII